MLSKTIFTIAVLLACSVSYAHGDEYGCYQWENWTCVPGPAFSVENIHQVHDMTAREGPPFLKASWHESEPILVYLGGFEPRPKDVKIIRWIDTNNVFERSISSHEPPGRGAILSTVAVVSDELIAGTIAGSVYVWDLMKEELLYELIVGNAAVTTLLHHPTSEWLLVAIDYARLFRVDLELGSVAEINLLGNEDQVLDVVAFSNDGLLLAAAGGGKLAVWDTSSWEAWEPQDLVDDTVGILRFTEDSSQLLVSAGATVSRWSLNEGRLAFGQGFLPYAGRRHCIITVGDVSHDGSLLMTGDDCGHYRAWDLVTSTELYIPQLHQEIDTDPVKVMLFSPDGRVLFAGSYSGYSYLFIHQPE